MALTFYWYPYSQPSRAVMTLLKLTEVKFEAKVVDYFKKEHKEPEYLKVHPLGQIPAMDDDGFTLGESEAIMKYIMNSRNVGEKYYPSDPKKRALVDRYFPFHHSTTRPGLGSYFAAYYVDIMGFPITLEIARPKAEDTCKKLEEVFLKDTKYVAGDEITIADFLAVNEMTMLYFATDFDFTKFPKVKEYIERCLENSVLAELNEPVKGLSDYMNQIREQKKQ
jgi:glutathione S-transferase